MKKFLVLLLFVIPNIVLANPGHRHHFHGHRHWVSPPSYNWIAPALIGGAVVYAVTRPDPVVIHQPSVMLQPNQIVIDGIVYTKQILIINGVQTEVLVKQ